MYQTILFTNEKGITTIKLNRPEVYNAFNEEMSKEVIDALKKAAKDPKSRVVVIAAEGKAFCSGQDLKDIKGKIGDRNLGDSVIRRYNPMVLGIRNMPKPVICSLNGVAAGAGCSLALACDLIVASEKASMLQAFVKIGLVLDSGASFFLPKLMSYHKAFELATKGDKISAQEALELGMVNKVVPADKLEETVHALAAEYAKAPTKAIGMIKSILNKSYTGSLEDILQEEAYGQEIVGYSDDYKEGVTSFIEKRAPDFKGN